MTGIDAGVGECDDKGRNYIAKEGLPRWARNRHEEKYIAIIVSDGLANT
jgi:hypothetical protein